MIRKKEILIVPLLSICSWSKKFRSDKRIVLAVVSSGIASLLLTGGKTAHSVFKILLQPDEMSICFFDKRSERAELIRETTLIIWDEAPMMNRLAFKAVNRHLKDICDNENAFGGKLVVLGGDFNKYFQWLHIDLANGSFGSCMGRVSFGLGHFEST